MRRIRPTSLQSIRRAIDRIDRRLVRLLGERAAFVKAAARFKRTAAEVRAPARVTEVIGKVRRLSRRRGLDPEITERVYRAMIAAFIRSEMVEYSKLRARRGRRARGERS
jgi:isochorismate pyruvate lyase